MGRGFAIRTLRHLIRKSPPSRSVCFSLNETLIYTGDKALHTSPAPSGSQQLHYNIGHSTTYNSQLLYRNMCSSTSGPSNIVMIKSEEEFNSSLRKAEDESLPAIFYFTAAWCGPCRLLSPIIGHLSEKYPQVTTYKIDIDQEGLESTLSKLSIYSVPALHFYKNGKRASEVIGADVNLLKSTYEKLYD